MIKGLLGIFFLSLFSCAQRGLISDHEYKPVYEALDPQKGEDPLSVFPKKERGGFITSTEKAWLSFWRGGGESKDLLRQANTLDERNFISLQRETETFFFGPTEDGYIPAEHEVIALHLIASMIFLQKKEFTKARVEASAATYFLKTYDDPALRLWMAGVWTALGEWEEARVDFRRVYELTHNPRAKELEMRESPPENLNLVFLGTGPNLTWERGHSLPVFAEQKVFKSSVGELGFSTLPWFERHQRRNSFLQEQIKNSKYMAQYYGIEARTHFETGMTYAFEGSIKTVGVLLGLSISLPFVYYGAQANSSELINVGVGAGLLVGTYFWDQSTVLRKKSIALINRDFETELEKIRIYRYVRFLPSRVIVSEKYQSGIFQIGLKSLRSRNAVIFTWN